MALVVFALSSACLTPFNPTYKTTKLYPPVGWVERMPQKPVKSEKNKTFTRDATATRKPRETQHLYLTPFNPTYKTTKLYPPVGWVERMPQKLVKSEKNKTFTRDATATRKPRETQHLYCLLNTVQPNLQDYRTLLVKLGFTVVQPNLQEKTKKI